MPFHAMARKNRSEWARSQSEWDSFPGLSGSTHRSEVWVLNGSLRFLNVQTPWPWGSSPVWERTKARSPVVREYEDCRSHWWISVDQSTRPGHGTATSRGLAGECRIVSCYQACLIHVLTPCAGLSSPELFLSRLLASPLRSMRRSRTWRLQKT